MSVLFLSTILVGSTDCSSDTQTGDQHWHTTVRGKSFHKNSANDSVRSNRDHKQGWCSVSCIRKACRRWESSWAVAFITLCFPTSGTMLQRGQKLPHPAATRTSLSEQTVSQNCEPNQMLPSLSCLLFPEKMETQLRQNTWWSWALQDKNICYSQWNGNKMAQ